MAIDGSPVSLIKGPPGTGKTQVVANIIMNAAINGQTVLFTSKNNNAVDVVVKRVNSLNKDLPLILRYEKDAKQCISDYTQHWERAKAKKDSFSEELDDYKRVYHSYHSKQYQKQQIVDNRNKLDQLEQLICGIRDKYCQWKDQVDGEEIVIAKGAYLELGSNTFIPGFEDQLTGHKVGDKVDVNVTFPENYPAENLAGKDVVFKVTVQGVVR